MSYQEAAQPVCTETTGCIELVIEPKEKDLGEFSVRRVLPARERRMVGPFIFFDHMGPAEFPPGKGISVRPHPHIGLATVTYLFEGQIMHRDSLGVVQPIGPGAVNLMTAGRGIVHSERAGDDLDRVSRLHGIQTWMALPDEKQEMEPAFVHTPASDLPDFVVDDVRVRVIAGTAYAHTSPVAMASPTLYAELRIPTHGAIDLPSGYSERAFYVVSGELQVEEKQYGDGVMGVASPRGTVRLEAQSECHVMVIGGEPVGERHVWWNFVSSTKARIEQAKTDWREGRFAGVPGDAEFIPLPE